MQRFWQKVSIGAPEACWLWMAGDNGRYGKFRLSGRKEMAHRVAWLLTFGEIPDNLCVCHTCDNGFCCNPVHLFLGTHKQNMEDKIAKGRDVPPKPRKGHDHHLAKLKDEHVITIREMAESGTPHKTIAKLFGICRANVGYIVQRKTWTHI